jgi:hypothetical protein
LGSLLGKLLHGRFSSQVNKGKTLNVVGAAAAVTSREQSQPLRGQSLVTCVLGHLLPLPGVPAACLSRASPVVATVGRAQLTVGPVCF